MSGFGFRTWDANSNVQVDSDSIAVLYIDDFALDPSQGTITKTYAGLAGATVTVMVQGSGNLAPGATVTQADVSSDKQITFSTQKQGRFRMMLE